MRYLPVLTLVLFIPLCSSQDFDEFCTLRGNGRKGRCLLISNCPEALEDLHMRNIHPQTCGFQGTQPIVCCESGGSVLVTTTTGTTTTSKTSVPLLQLIEAVSDKASTKVVGETSRQNEFCTRSNGRKGRCLLISNCPKALEDLHMRNIHPQTCGFQGIQPIICCESGGSVPVTATTATTTTSRTSVPLLQLMEAVSDKESIKVVGETSRKKCREYVTYAFDYPSPELGIYADSADYVLDDNVADVPSKTNPSLGSRTDYPSITDLSDQSETANDTDDYPWIAILSPGSETHDNTTDDTVAIYSSTTDFPLRSEVYVGVTKLVIAGGIEVQTRRLYPHMALLGFDVDGRKAWKCGGSLISEQFVMTAAHCLYDEGRYVKYVLLGDLVIGSTTDDADPREFEVIERLRHPNYLPPSAYNDIALLKLDRPAQFNAFIRPACLYTWSELPSTQRPIATGWGATSYQGSISSELREVELEYFTFEECQGAFKDTPKFKLRNGIQEEKQLCAGSHNELKDTCKGDSGGPLQVSSSDVIGMLEIVGVTSIGTACGVLNKPAVYTRVSSYIDWIEHIVWGS